jgi:sugar/nucleoside kinase (ribokinase family)
MSLLVVGTVAFDQVETPFGKTDKILGGAATYIGLAASHFYDNIRLVSVVGGDFPQEYLNLFHDRKIDTQGLRIIQDGKSFFWSGRYGLDMNTRDTLATDLNVLADFDPVLPPAYLDSKYVMLGNLTPCIQKKVITQMSRKPALTCMDTMNFWMNTCWDDLLDVLKLVDVLTINDEEARQLSGEYSLMKAARKIRAMGPEFLIVKKGEHGAMLFGENQTFYAPALPLDQVFDPTGAGDSFAGGFMGYIAQKDNVCFETMKQAIVYGSVVASFTVEEFGTSGLLKVKAKDIQERLKEFVKLSCVTL